VLGREGSAVQLVREERVAAQRVRERQASLVDLLDAAVDPAVERAEDHLDAVVERRRLREQRREWGPSPLARADRLGEPRPQGQPWLIEAIGTARWRGVELAPLLEEAGVRDGAVEVLFTALDRGIDGGVEQAYERSLTVEEALAGDALLTFELNGETLPPQHGAPLRLVVPGWYGMTSVKWLERITVLDSPFDGYQQSHAYRFRRHEEDDGEPVTRMRPRALMVPPGMPDFLTRRRFVPPGPCRLEGRAWSGVAPIASVEVGVDGDWTAAAVEPAPDRWAWSRWTFEWQAEPGDHELRCRARDESGNEQPLEPEWNVGGYCNNSAQRIAVTVR